MLIGQGRPMQAEAAHACMSPLGTEQAYCIGHALTEITPAQVTRDLFIEPNSGKAFPVDEGPYTDVEFLWNQYNFWSATPQACGQDALADPLVFDLEDTSRWRHLLDHPAYQVRGAACCAPLWICPQCDFQAWCG